MKPATSPSSAKDQMKSGKYAGTELGYVLKMYENDRHGLVVFDHSLSVYYVNKIFQGFDPGEIREIARYIRSQKKYTSETLFFKKWELEIQHKLFDSTKYMFIRVYPVNEPPIYEQLFKHSNKASVVINERYEIVILNKQYEEFLEYYFEKIILKGDSLLSFCTEEQKEFLINTTKKALTGIVTEYEYALMLNGKHAYCAVCYEPVRDQHNEIHSVMITVRDITDERAKYEELEKIAVIAQANSIGSLVCNAKGEIEWTNAAFEELTGYTLEEMKGRLAADFLHGEKTNTMAIQRINTNLLSKEPFTEEILNYKKSGETYWVKLHINPILNAKNEITRFVSVARDITEEISVKKKLLAENIQREALLEAIPDLIYRLRSDGTYLDCRAGNPDDLMLPANEIIGMNYFDLPESEALKSEVWKHIQNVVRTGKMQIVEYQRKNAKGKMQFYEARISKSGTDQAIYLVRNITERKKHEKEILLAKEKAEELVKLKSNFLANMSHEIRTPLNGILGLAEVIDMSNDLNEIKEMVAFQKESGKRLLDTLTSIIHLSRLESQIESDEQINLIEINDLLHKIEGIYSLQALHKKINFSYIPTDEKLYVLAEETLLYQVFNNVIHNALKFTPKGEVAIRVLRTEIHSEPFVEIQIIDTGIGISEEFQPHVFESFRQESQGISRNYQGSGVGLSIAKKYVLLMGGDITFQSKKNEGTIFTINIPLYTI